MAEAARGKPILRARLRLDAVVASELIGRSVLAFAGIARPEKFLATLAEIGARVAATRLFADHHAFTSREIEALLARAAARNLNQVTTEKDQARIAPEYANEMVALPVTLKFDEAGGGSAAARGGGPGAMTWRVLTMIVFRHCEFRTGLRPVPWMKRLSDIP